MPKTNKEWAEELEPLSKTLRRDVTGDIEWTATQFREFINHAHDLCNAVDRFTRDTSTGGFVVHERVRVKASGVEGRVTAPWYRGGVWVNDLGPYDPSDLERI